MRFCFRHDLWELLSDSYFEFRATVVGKEMVVALKVDDFRLETSEFLNLYVGLAAKTLELTRKKILDQPVIALDLLLSMSVLKKGCRSTKLSMDVASIIGLPGTYGSLVRFPGYR